MILFLVVFCMVVAIGFGIAAAVSDFKSMNIPNLYAGLIVLAFIPAFAADAVSGEGMEFFASWKSHLISGAVVFGITFSLFALRIIGAGDSKLCSAFAVWVGVSGLAAFLFYMAITGALLGLATKIMNKRMVFQTAGQGGWIEKSQNGGTGVPYGIAICVGAIAAFYQLDYFSPAQLAKLAGVVNNDF